MIEASSKIAVFAGYPMKIGDMSLHVTTRAPSYTEQAHGMSFGATLLNIQYISIYRWL
jgi:hypothetical protein